MKSVPQLGDIHLPLDQLTELDAIACGSALRLLRKSASTRQAVAERIVSYFYESFRSETGEPSCVLARCFQTTSYASLPMDYQDAADRLLDFSSPEGNMRCLTLLATRGDKSTWNDVATSISHQAIPLPSVEVVRRAPMIARLLEQLNVPFEHVVASDPPKDFLIDGPSQTFNVFHVEQALGSPYIPEQDSFVKAFGVKSVLGAGGLLVDGELFVLVLFTRVVITRRVAELFRLLAEDVKEALAPFDGRRIFSGYYPAD